MITRSHSELQEIAAYLRGRFRNAIYQYEDLQEREFIEEVLLRLRQELGERFQEYDFWLYSTCGESNPPIPLVLEGTRKRVLLYISDETGLDPSFLGGFFFAVFKCYLRREQNLPANIFPLPIGCSGGFPEPILKPIPQRRTNVLFLGNLNGNRYPLYRELTWLRLLPCGSKLLSRIIRHGRAFLPLDCSGVFPQSCIKFTDGFKQGVSVAEYGRLLADAKIAICPPGFISPETFRHFEAMRTGCVVVSAPLPDTHFYREAPFVIVDDWRQLRSRVWQLLRQPELLEELGAAALKWWTERCSPKAVAGFIKAKLDFLEGLE